MYNRVYILLSSQQIVGPSSRALQGFLITIWITYFYPISSDLIGPQWSNVWKRALLVQEQYWHHLLFWAFDVAIYCNANPYGAPFDRRSFVGSKWVRNRGVNPAKRERKATYRQEKPVSLTRSANKVDNCYILEYELYSFSCYLQEHKSMSRTWISLGSWTASFCTNSE